MELQTKLRENMAGLYETPIPFWQKVLGQDLHFHLGHFRPFDNSLRASMTQAVNDLVEMIPNKNITRVLDVGCGWGGPAFQLTKIWNAEILGLTISTAQTRYVNSEAWIRGLPVRAKTIDLENYQFGSLERFDVLWLYEVLEHIVDPKTLLTNIRQACFPDSILAVAVSCRSSLARKKEIFSDVLGVQPLATLPQICDWLTESGWIICGINDHTQTALPVWTRWLDNLGHVEEVEYQRLVDRLSIEFSELQKLFDQSLLQSVQITARAS